MGSVLIEQVNRLSFIIKHDISVRDEDLDHDSLHSITKCLRSATGAIVQFMDLHLGAGMYVQSDIDWSNLPDSLSVALAELNQALGQLGDFLESGLADPYEYDIKKVLTSVLDNVEASVSIAHDVRLAQAASPYPIAHSGENLVIVGHYQERGAASVEPSNQISVAMYVDGDDEAIKKVLARVDHLVDALGYGSPTEEQIEHGSIFRRYLAALKRGLSSRDAREGFIKAERALELLAIDTRQAQVDEKVAAAVSGLVESFEDVPQACVRVGSIFFVKYTGATGPIVLARNLSQVEIRAMEKFPEIQRNPEKAFEALALAVTQLEGS
jgi:hypothetical protein